MKPFFILKIPIIFAVVQFYAKKCEKASEHLTVSRNAAVELAATFHCLGSCGMWCVCMWCVCVVRVCVYVCVCVRVCAHVCLVCAYVRVRAYFVSIQHAQRWHSHLE